MLRKIIVSLSIVSLCACGGDDSQNDLIDKIKDFMDVHNKDFTALLGTTFSRFLSTYGFSVHRH